jgi:hypothetical protein
LVLQEVAVKRFLDQAITGDSLEEFRSEVQSAFPLLSLFPSFLFDKLPIVLEA